MMSYVHLCPDKPTKILLCVWAVDWANGQTLQSFCALRYYTTFAPMCASIDISIIVNERRLVHMKLYDLQYKLLFLDLKLLPSSYSGRQPDGIQGSKHLHQIRPLLD